jgi:hypothetical protein
MRFTDAATIAQHLHRALALRARLARPVRRHAQQLGPAQGGRARPLGELEVVADHQRDPAVRRVEHRRRRIAGREEEQLAVPQVRLAVDRADAARIDERGAVVEHAVGAALGEAAGDHEPVRRCAPRPARYGRAVRRLGERPRLRRVLEHVAGGGQLGQHDDLRAGAGRRVDRGERRVAVGFELADSGDELVAGDSYGGHGGTVDAGARPAR